MQPRVAGDDNSCMDDAERQRILDRYREHAARFEQQSGSKRATSTPVLPAPAPAVREPSTPTVRELEVLQLIADGLANQEIAARLVVSVETVKSHVRANLGKLNASSRAHAVAIALRNGHIN